MAIYLTSGKAFKLEGPNPLVSLDMSYVWKDDDLQYENWRSFAPSVKNEINSCAPVSTLALAIGAINTHQQESEESEWETPPPPNLPDLKQSALLTSSPAISKPIPEPMSNMSEWSLPISVNNATQEDGTIPFFFYQLVNANSYDKLYGQSRDLLLQEKPITIFLIQELNNGFKFRLKEFVQLGIGMPLPGSLVMNPRTEQRFRVIDCDVKQEGVIIQVEQERW